MGTVLRKPFFLQCCGYSYQSTHKYQEKNTETENTAIKVNATELSQCSYNTDFLQPSKPARMHVQPTPVITEYLVDKSKLKCKINRTTDFFCLNNI